MKLHELIAHHFNEDEFVELCKDLGISHEQFSGENLTRKTLELVGYYERRRKTHNLIDAILSAREELEPELWAYRTPNKQTFIDPPETRKLVMVMVIGVVIVISLMAWFFFPDEIIISPTAVQTTPILLITETHSTTNTSTLPPTNVPTVNTAAINTADAATATNDERIRNEAGTRETIHVQGTVVAGQATAAARTASLVATAFVQNPPVPKEEEEQLAIAPTAQSSVVLIMPENMGIQSTDECRNDRWIVFEWEWGRELLNDGFFGGEFFAVRFGLAEDGPHSIVWTKNRNYVLDTHNEIFNMQAGEIYAWNIAVVEPFSEPEHENWVAVDRSEDWYFEYCGSGGQVNPIPEFPATITPTPTLVPSFTPTPVSTSSQTQNPTAPPVKTPDPSPTPEPFR